MLSSGVSAAPHSSPSFPKHDTRVHRLYTLHVEECQLRWGGTDAPPSPPKRAFRLCSPESAAAGDRRRPRARPGADRGAPPPVHEGDARCNLPRKLQLVGDDEHGVPLSGERPDNVQDLARPRTMSSRERRGVAPGMEGAIPPEKNRKEPREQKGRLDAFRHLVENAFLHLKRWRGIAARHAKNAASFVAAAQIRRIALWSDVS